MISPVMQAILELEAPVKKLRCALRSCQDFSQGVSINGGHPKMDDGKKLIFQWIFYGAPPHLWNLPYVSIQTSRLYFLMSSWSWLILGMELFAHPAR